MNNLHKKFAAYHNTILQRLKEGFYECPDVVRLTNLGVNEFLKKFFGATEKKDGKISVPPIKAYIVETQIDLGEFVNDIDNAIFWHREDAVKELNLRLKELTARYGISKKDAEDGAVHTERDDYFCLYEYPDGPFKAQGKIYEREIQ